MLGELPLSKYNKIVNLLICGQNSSYSQFDAKKILVFTALFCHIRTRCNAEKHISIKKTSNFNTLTNCFCGYQTESDCIYVLSAPIDFRTEWFS